MDGGGGSNGGSDSDGDGYVIAQVGCDGPKLTGTTIESSRKSLI